MNKRLLELYTKHNALQVAARTHEEIERFQEIYYQDYPELNALEKEEQVAEHARFVARYVTRERA